MAKQERIWHPDFFEYMEMIVNHPNYAGLPIVRKLDGSLGWIATAKSEIGRKRKEWAERKARTLGLPICAGVYAAVMREVHPTKIHICQICGSRMSIYYHYPSVNFVKAIEREFGLEFSETDHIGDIWDELLSSGIDVNRIIQFMRYKVGLPNSVKNSKNDIIAACEHECRKNGKKMLSPGAMSNFPDRYDGFHTYNRCCRATEDKVFSFLIFVVRTRQLRHKRWRQQSQTFTDNSLITSVQ